MTRRMFTGYPQVDPRMPHTAPLWGAAPLGDAAPGDTSVNPQPTEAVPAALLGIGASALNGAMVGGVAGQSWAAAGVGAALSASLWSGWTFIGSYPLVGQKTKLVLGTGAVAAGLALMVALAARRKS